ncbi:MAG TPA: HEAT repeat domain-containing protein [Myxococcaceae bacterium]|nr:HEAT repeat domain-containing protein [Myxococcaceae bacterium]
MRRGLWRIGWVLALVLGAGACRCGPQPFEVLSLRAAVVDPSVPGLTDAELETWLAEAVKEVGILRFTPEQESAPAGTQRDGVRLQLEVPLMQPVFPADAEEEQLAIVLTLHVRRMEEGLAVHDRLEVLIQSPIGEEAPLELGSRLIRKALPPLLKRAGMHLEAARKSPDALVADLSSEDHGLREAALRILVERRDPRAFRGLEAELATEDPMALRRAIGLAVELGDQRAVPLLIALAQDREPSLLREILYALAALGGREAQSYLFTIASGHDSPAVRAMAEEALDQLTGSAPGAGSTLH